MSPGLVPFGEMEQMSLENVFPSRGRHGSRIRRKLSVSYDEIISMDHQEMSSIKYLIVYIQTELCDGSL